MLPGVLDLELHECLACCKSERGRKLSEQVDVLQGVLELDLREYLANVKD